MKKHISVRVTGRVQGVYFRASATERARELGVFGFVRNEEDGAVYAEAEGQEASLDAFVSWMKRGPARAVVESCSVMEGSIQNYSEFIIQR